MPRQAGRRVRRLRISERATDAGRDQPVQARQEAHQGLWPHDWEKMRYVVKELMNDRPLDPRLLRTRCEAAVHIQKTLPHHPNGEISTEAHFCGSAHDICP